MAQSQDIAIIGGGLCGLALAIGLAKRSIPFTIYEGSASFREIGAGLNVGPNGLRAMALLDESLGDAIYGLCTRNPPGKEHVWMQMRFGAPRGDYGDGDLIADLMAPPTGNMTIHRNDLLQKLAEIARGEERAMFNKKLTSLQQDDEGVTMTFADGTEARAAVVIACDGVHSAVRRAIVGAASPAAAAQYSNVGAYRGILSVKDLGDAIGYDRARTSQVYLGPRGYVITYPVENAKNVNVGFWPWKHDGPWLQKGQWVVPAQKAEMEKDFEDWGEMIHKIMKLMGDPPFFATYYHSIQPEAPWKGRVCLIGDASHAMPPHQGAGSGQAMEDAYVLAEILGAVVSMQGDNSMPQKLIKAAFSSFESVRMKRAQRVLETSQEAMSFWTDLYEGEMTKDKVEAFRSTANDRFYWIWHDDIAAQAKQALEALKQATLSQ